MTIKARDLIITAFAVVAVGICAAVAILLLTS
jgi:hypothetical protein